MKKLFYSLTLLAILWPSMLFADTDMRDAAVLTASYVSSGAINCQNAQQISIEVIVASAQAKTCNLLAQWSVDNVNWVTEPVNVAGTATATEQPYTRLDKRFDFSVNVTGMAFGETFTRWGGYKWFRVQVKESSGSGSTATVQIKGSTSKFNP